MFLVQWSINDGKCGVCGDAYDQAQPRRHEAGGEYGRGIISRHYFAGQVRSIETIMSSTFFNLNKYGIIFAITAHHIQYLYSL